jgi:D-alanyl-D-alanine dipeptidase
MKPESRRYHLVYKRVMMMDAKDSAISRQGADTSYLEYVFKSHDLTDISKMDTSIIINLRYADTNNFLKKNFYDGLSRAYFNCETAIRICNAQTFLKEENPNYSLVIFDASRPQHLQQMMWDSLQMHPGIKLKYLASPLETSLHNYGCAVDAGIYDAGSGKMLNMGSDFDFFGGVSQPKHEEFFLKTGDLTKDMIANRELLRKVMKKAGLNPITSEWWHFSSYKRPEAAAKFPLIR